MISRLPVVFAVLLAAGLYAQRAPAPSHYGAPSGFGNVNHPGTPYSPRVVYPSVVTSSTYANRMLNPNRGGSPGSSFRGGYPASGGFARGVSHPHHSRQIVVPVPVVIGGYYPYDMSGYAPLGYAQDSGVEQQAATPPVVIINQSYQPETADGDGRDYSAADAIRPYDAPVHPMPDPNDLAPARRAEDDKPTLYLIAFKDHTILPSLAYWVEGDTLNYITEQGSPNHASLSLIDKDFSKQLNRERHVDFSLPN